MFGSQRVIATAASGLFAVYATDLDGDGLQDVVMVAAAMDNDGFNPLPESTSIDLDHDGYDDLAIGAEEGNGGQKGQGSNAEGRKRRDSRE